MDARVSLRWSSIESECGGLLEVQRSLNRRFESPMRLNVFTKEIEGTPTATSSFIDFVLTGESTIHEEDVQEVIRLANEYEVYELWKSIWDHIIKTIDTSVEYHTTRANISQSSNRDLWVSETIESMKTLVTGADGWKLLLLDGVDPGTSMQDTIKDLVLDVTSESDDQKCEQIRLFQEAFPKFLEYDDLDESPPLWGILSCARDGRHIHTLRSTINALDDPDYEVESAEDHAWADSSTILSLFVESGDTEIE